MSILPNILNVAEEYGIKYEKTKGRDSEYKANCPFCDDKQHSFQFNINANAFICNRYNHCGKRGGVLELLVLLSGKTKEEIVKELREHNGLNAVKSNRNHHPALDIPVETLRDMGFITRNLNWYESMRRDPERTRRELDWIWAEYQEYVEVIKERRKAVKRMFALCIKQKGMDHLIECLTK